MSRIYDHYATLADKKIGYGIAISADGYYFVRFLNSKNERCKRSTGVTASSGGKKEVKEKEAEAHQKAVEVIAREYAVLVQGKEKISWDDAIKLWTTKFSFSGNRPSTLKSYIKDMNLIRRFYSATHGPADIDEQMACTWFESYMSSTDARCSDGKGKKKSPHSVNVRLGMLYSIWNTWFIKTLGICTVNPFEKINFIKTDKKEIRYMTDEQWNHLLAFFRNIFPNWEMPIMFLRLKEISGCRLGDICGLETSALRTANTVIFPAALLKGRQERSVPIPDEGESSGLYAALVAYSSGKKFLWEKYPTELGEVLKTSGRLMAEFSPTRLYRWIHELFERYQREHPERETISSHMLRKRAFTKGHQHGIPISTLAVMYGCNEQTVKGHYAKIDTKKVAELGWEQLKTAQAASKKPE